MTTTDRSPNHYLFAVLTVSNAAFLMLQGMVSPVLPLLQRDLHTTQDSVTWVLTAYLLSASVFTPILGRIGDAVGKQRVLVLVLLAVGLGCALSAVASSLAVMIVARAIQGLGGGIIPLSFGIIRDTYPADAMAAAVGTLAGLLSFGAGLGLVIAGPIVAALDIHWLFWIPAIVFALGVAATIKVVPPSPVRPYERINWSGAVLLSAWLVCLLVAVSQAPRWGWGGTRVIGLLVGAVVLLAGWVVAEDRAANPLIDLQMMRLPAVWTANLVSFFFGASLYTTYAFLPQFVQTPSAEGYGFGLSITQSGLVVLPLAVTTFLCGSAAGVLSRRYGSKSVLLLGAVASLIGLVLLLVTHGQIWQIVIALGVVGAGIGFVFAAMSGIIVGAVRADQTGVASGMNANLRTIGGAIGAALMATLVTSAGTVDGFPRSDGYVRGFALLAAFGALAVVAGALIPATRRRPPVVAPVVVGPAVVPGQ